MGTLICEKCSSNWLKTEWKSFKLRFLERPGTIMIYAGISCLRKREILQTRHCEKLIKTGNRLCGNYIEYERGRERLWGWDGDWKSRKSLSLLLFSSSCALSAALTRRAKLNSQTLSGKSVSSRHDCRSMQILKRQSSFFFSLHHPTDNRLWKTVKNNTGELFVENLNFSSTDSSWLGV